MGHTAAIRGIAFAPGGETAVSCSTDATVKLWKVGVCVWLYVFILQLAVGVGVAWVLHGRWWDNGVLQHGCQCEIMEGRFVCVCVYGCACLLCNWLWVWVLRGCCMGVGGIAVSCSTNAAVKSWKVGSCVHVYVCILCVGLFVAMCFLQLAVGVTWT